jgi:opine dehydrogenase
MKKVAVLGASHAGQALAGILAIQGSDVRIYDHPDFKQNIEGILQNGGIIELTDQMSESGKVSLATTDIQAAVRGVDVIMLIVPSFAQEIFLKLVAPHLEDGQLLFILPGNLGSILARKIIDKTGNRKKIMIAEANSVPLASRMIKPGLVAIYGNKKFLDMAALPSIDTDEAIRRLSDCFPIPLHPVENVLKVAFTNFNMLVHCTTSVMNTGWIETSNGNFDFYKDGISPSVCRVLESIDHERTEICGGLSLLKEPFISWWKRAYPPDEDYQTLYEVIHNSKVHTGRGSSAPKTMQARYVTEDIPYILVPLAAFGRLLNKRAETTEAIIHLASTLNKTNYYDNGRNLENLGFSNLKPNEILGFVTTGAN